MVTFTTAVSIFTIAVTLYRSAKFYESLVPQVEAVLTDRVEVLFSDQHGFDEGRDFQLGIVDVESK